MSNDEAYKETALMLKQLINICSEYARKDGIGIPFVLRIAAKGMIQIADNIERKPD